MLLLFLLPLVIGIAVAIIAPYLKIELAVDRCLDQGGSYNRESGNCRYK